MESVKTLYETVAEKPRGKKSGWQEREDELLTEQVARIKDLGLPLRAAFEEAARLTGRQPNSVRNHYYTRLRQKEENAPAFVPFSEEESLSLLKEVLLSRTGGESVRACTMRLAAGDTQRMLRYQNKYRALLKSRPDLIEQARRELLEQQSRVFDPYERPASIGPGRPRKENGELLNAIEGHIKALCQSLMELAKR